METEKFRSHRVQGPSDEVEFWTKPTEEGHKATDKVVLRIAIIAFLAIYVVWNGLSVFS